MDSRLSMYIAILDGTVFAVAERLTASSRVTGSIPARNKQKVRRKIWLH